MVLLQPDNCLISVSLCAISTSHCWRLPKSIFSCTPCSLNAVCTSICSSMAASWSWARCLSISAWLLYEADSAPPACCCAPPLGCCFRPSSSPLRRSNSGSVCLSWAFTFLSLLSEFSWSWYKPKSFAPVSSSSLRSISRITRSGTKVPMGSPPPALVMPFPASKSASPWDCNSTSSSASSWFSFLLRTISSKNHLAFLFFCSNWYCSVRPWRNWS
mmetsp:Transcript_2231/g.7456  ORF Transcript_2231/g.7456 Transcript_2231/m.7456 type:complete len:216 (-) Transcript_2231:1794-2441(-)